MALRAAIVGAGLMGGWHARYAARVGARIEAVVDERPERAAALARRFSGARAFAELGQCLGAQSIDVVHVCTGRESHALLVETALAAGAHVLVEKPAAAGAAAARRLVDLAQRAGRTLCPVHQFPFQAGMKRLLRDLPRLGGVVHATHVVASTGGEGLSALDRRMLLADITPHALSLFRGVLGAGVDAADWRVMQATADMLDLTAFHADARLSVLYSLDARPIRNELIVCGTRATARADLFHGFAAIETGRPSRLAKLLAPFRASGGVAVRASANLLRRTVAREAAYPGLLALVRGFYASLRDGGPPPVSGEELVASSELVERILSRAPA